MRKLEIVRDEFIMYGNKNVEMPRRATLYSAGYDFFSPIDITIEPNGQETIFTNIKVKMNEDETFILANRSSFGRKGIILANAIGIVDYDYYENPNNDGNMGFALKNTTDKAFVIKKGDRIGQGMFMKFFTADNEIKPTSVRTGGYGSTGVK